MVITRYKGEIANNFKMRQSEFHEAIVLFETLRNLFVPPSPLPHKLFHHCLHLGLRFQGNEARMGWRVYGAVIDFLTAPYKICSQLSHCRY